MSSAEDRLETRDKQARLSTSRLLEAFREAGFDDRQAARGAEMMRSRRYFGFADVATTLASVPAVSPFGRTTQESQPLSPTRRELIEAIEHRLMRGEDGAGKSGPITWKDINEALGITPGEAQEKPTVSPWGRPLEGYL